MKVTVRTNETAKEVEVVICCRCVTPDIERLISRIQAADKELAGRKDGETFLIPAKEVLYIDTADKRTFLYTKEAVYETGGRLYELESRLLDMEFFRANKSCIVNWRQIASIRAELNRRLLLTMSNGEKLVVSRQYAEGVRQRLEVK